MKKYFKFLGVALVATSLCFAMASCTKDNNEDGSDQGGQNPPPSGGAQSATITFDGASWSPESSGYVYAYYVENGENTYVAFALWSKTEGTNGYFPAVQARIFAMDGEQKYKLNQFYCNYATNPGHIREEYLRDNDGNKYTVWDYTYAPSVQGTLNVSGFSYNASNMKASFTLDMDMIEPAKYYGDNDEDGNPDGVIDMKHCKIVASNLQFQAPPQSKAVAEKIAANNNITVK